MNKEEIKLLLQLLAQIELELPDDQKIEHLYSKGFKAGIIASLNILTHSSFKYNCPAKEILINLKRRF